jgi:hypothetical protein
MITQHLERAPFAARFLLQLIKMLGEQIADGARWFDFSGQRAFSGEDAQQHLDAVL